jgi:small subunit ribosomal protein S6
MNRTYEVMYIVRPDLEEADLEKLIEGFNTVVTTGGGEVTNIEKLGRRRLAYIVRKFQDGIYVLLHISADGPLVAELERRLRVTEQVIKFITVRTDEENKRLAKVKAHRDSKVKLSAQHVPAAAPVAAPASVETPAAEVAAEPVAEAAAEPEVATTA